MSSILKAIRKIEDERRSGDNKSPDIMIDHGQSSSETRKSLLLPLLSGLFLGGVTVGIITWGILDSRESSLTKTTNVQSQTVRSQPQNTEISKQASTAKNDGVLLEKATEQRPPDEEISARAQDISQAAPLLSSQIKSTPVVTETASLAVPVGTEPELPALSNTPVGIDLLVSEIFYSENTSESMAVVNDLPVMVGTHIDSAIVTAIHTDRVDFQVSGKVYTVEITQP